MARGFDLTGIYTKIDELVEAYRKELESQGINCSGLLSNSASNYTLTDNNGLIEIVFNLAPHWVYVENGRKPGKQPPTDVIERWIQQKPVTLYADPKTGKVPTLHQAAFLIARSIGRNGIQGRHPMANVLAGPGVQILQDITQDLANQLGRRIQTHIKIN